MTVHESTPGHPGDASLVVTGDPETCRCAAGELRVLSARSGHASDLFVRYSTVGLSQFLGESATAFKKRCSTDPGSELVARRAGTYADGLEQLGADIVEVRRGMSGVRDFARSHGLRVVGAPDVSERVLPPTGDASLALGRAWVHVCALVAWQRQRERAAHARWLAVLDTAADRSVEPVPEVGPAPTFVDRDHPAPGADEPGAGAGPGSGPGAGAGAGSRTEAGAGSGPGSGRPGPGPDGPDAMPRPDPADHSDDMLPAGSWIATGWLADWFDEPGAADVWATECCPAVLGAADRTSRP